MKVNIWRLIALFTFGFILGGGIAVRTLIPHLKPDITISTIYKRKVKVQDQGTVESTMNVEDITQDNTETKTKNKKNRVRRRDR